jgi:hypothetical protein
MQWSDQPSLKAVANNPPDQTINIHPGWAVVFDSLAGNTEIINIPEDEIPLPTNYPRIDLVVLHRNGAFEVVLGNESEIPVPPAVPDHSIELAQIVHRIGSDQILDEDDGVHSYIIDKRILMTTGESHRHSSDHSPSENPDGIRTQFSTQYKFIPGSLEVYLNGVLQEINSDYTEKTDQNSYTFGIAPLSHYRIQHRYIIQT